MAIGVLMTLLAKSRAAREMIAEDLENMVTGKRSFLFVCLFVCKCDCDVRDWCL